LFPPKTVFAFYVYGADQTSMGPMGPTKRLWGRPKQIYIYQTGEPGMQSPDISTYFIMQRFRATLKLTLGAVHKGRPQSGRFVKCGQGGSSDADVRTFWCKNAKFFEIYGVSARTRGEGGSASADILRTRGRVSIFRDFVRTSFMNGALT